MRSKLPLLLILSALLTSCTTGPPTLDGAVYQLPVYPSSRVTERGGGYLGDDPMNMPYHEWTWTLTSKDAPEQVMSFYMQHIPDATNHQVDAGPDSDRIVWRYPPAGGAQGEEIEISVDKVQKNGVTHFAVSEEVQRRKHGQ